MTLRDRVRKWLGLDELAKAEIVAAGQLDILDELKTISSRLEVIEKMLAPAIRATPRANIFTPGSWEDAQNQELENMLQNAPKEQN